MVAMNKQLPGTVLCPAIVGREADLALLSELVEQAIAGQGQVVCLNGEAGVGKSRLIAEARAYAIARGALVLQGNCFATDQSLPYAPLLDLFRAYFARMTPSTATEQHTPLLSELACLLPDLALLFPGALSEARTPDGDPEQQKRQLFAVMTQFFTGQTAQCPVLVIVEDLHWCDDLSLEFLLRLARRCREAPIMLLATYRSDEIQPQLRHWLARLDRERLSQDIALERLPRDGVAAMLQTILGAQQSADANLLDMLYTRSEGNPFYVEELLKSLVMTGGLAAMDEAWRHDSHTMVVPRSVQDAVQQRTSLLSGEACRLVSLAAIAGRRFDVALLQEVLGCDELRLTTLLKELLAAQLVSEEEADHFAFRHALTHEAISAGLLKRERRALHREIARTLERLSTTDGHSESHIEALAYHCYEAGMWRQALTYSLEAAEKARALYAQRAVIDHLTRAEESAKRLAQAIPAHLYLMRGQAYETLGDFTQAQSDYEQALTTASAERQGEMEWQSLLAIGFLWTGHDYERAGDWFRQALALAETLGDPTLRARSLNRLGNWLQNTGQIHAGLEAHQEALRLFELLDDKQGMAETLGQLGMAYYFSGDPARGVQEFFGRALELFAALDDQQSLHELLAARAMDTAPETLETTSSALRTHTERMRDAEESLRLARLINSQPAQAFAEMATSLSLASSGEFGSAIAHARGALRLATEIEHQEWIAASYGALGQIYLLLLAVNNAAACLEAALAGAQGLGSMLWTKQLTPYLALAYTQRREFSRAEAALRTITTITPREQHPNTFFDRQTARVWGELVLAQGEPAVALRIVDGLIASTPGDAHQSVPHLLALKGAALLALRRFEPAAQALEEAKQGAKQRKAPSILWRIQRLLGQVYHQLRQEEQAQREFAAAREIIARLALTIDDTALREHFMQTALALLPQERAHSPRTSAGASYGGLTAREREVAALVAQGCANREIAARLVVSERTAEAHVSNILGKLGFTTRAQIAAWAVEKGLTSITKPDELRRSESEKDWY